MHFLVSSAREDWLLFLTRTPSGKESLGSARNSGIPPPEEPGRNDLSLSLDLNFVTSSSLGIFSKVLDVVMVVLKVRIGLLRGPDESLQRVVRTQLAIIAYHENVKKTFNNYKELNLW